MLNSNSQCSDLPQPQYGHHLSLVSSVVTAPVSPLAESSFPIPENEAERLAALYQYDILDSLPEQDYDDLTLIAAQICGAPISLVTLLDRDRQWFKSRHGIDATQTPRRDAFCSHAIMQPDQVMVVPDALDDARFVNNPLVVGDPNIRFYAGAPLVNSEGYALGVLCVIDREPRNLSEQQINALQALSRQAIAQLELRRQTTQLRQEVQLREDAANLIAAKNDELERTLERLQQAQISLIQSEKMSALGQLVAGIAHEINNPISFIDGNINYCKTYINQLLDLVQLVRREGQATSAIATLTRDIDLDYILQDLPKLLTSMQTGARRIKDVVRLLRTFSRLDEEGPKPTDLHTNLDATLMLLDTQLQPTIKRPKIQLVKEYGKLPLVNCVPSQVNQVFMHLLYNALDALQNGVGHKNALTELPMIRISTSVTADRHVRICVADNGVGIPAATRPRIFDPFYTTKPVGKRTGMGLAISHQVIVEQHRGKIFCFSDHGKGTEFVVEIPLQ